MDKYENLLVIAENENLQIIEKCFRSKAKSFYKNNKIAISKSIETSAEKACILAEELGHYYTSYGDILDLKDTKSIKQEKRARNWAYRKLVPLNKLIDAYNAGLRSRYELAEYLGVIEEFLEEAINHYKEKHGLYIEYNEYFIYFEPLGVMRKID